MVKILHIFQVLVHALHTIQALGCSCLLQCTILINFIDTNPADDVVFLKPHQLLINCVLLPLHRTSKTDGGDPA